MEEDIRVVLRERCKKSIRLMEEWLEAQFLANAEEGTPRVGSDDLDDVPLSLLVSKGTDGRASESARGPEQSIIVETDAKIAASVATGQRRITSFFLVRD